MQKPVIFISLIIFLSACNLTDSKSGKKSSKDMNYSYSCLDSAISGSKTNKAISKTTDVIRDLAVDEDDITDALQSEYGDAFHKDAIETKTFVLLNNPAITTQLETVMNELLAQREKPSSIRYSIYLLDDKAINAFTFGGHIYITKAMYEKCKENTALLYSIIGHEIGHSEKGHIKKTIQELMLSEKVFGEDNGTFVFQIKKLLTGSFNQRNELEADYYGTDLTYRLNQDVCSAVTFWEEMAEEENQYNKLEDFFRSHPFSSLRAQCLRDHIQRNFGTVCNIVTK
jgi:predicted Zn-dependent protease